MEFFIAALGYCTITLGVTVLLLKVHNAWWGED